MNRKERRAASKRSPDAGLAGSDEISQLFAEAVRLHELGQIFDVEKLCRMVLSRNGGHAGALHLLGVLAMQRGLFEEAAGHFRKASDARPDIAIGHHSLGRALAAAGRLDAARGAFERAIALMPEFAEAQKDVGALLMLQGRNSEASARYARALELVPELAGNFGDTLGIMLKVSPALGEALARADATWPKLVPADEVLGPGFAAIGEDPMLQRVLKTLPIGNFAVEWFLTSARAALLIRMADAPDDLDQGGLGFACALARQCFNNEYVFAESGDELNLLERQITLLTDALEHGAAIPPIRLAVMASYKSLSSLPDPQRLLERAWPESVNELLTQQVREIEIEQYIRPSIPRLTAVEGEGTGAAVRRQYEENPYPRWVVAPSRPDMVGIDSYVKGRFPLSPYRPLGDRAALDILIAGCGTGEHSIGTARRYRGANVLAIDLSIPSLAYAERKTRELGLRNLEYAQADVMALSSIGRSFDVIDVSGVLHHLADPLAGWRRLLTLLRPGGLMRVGLYSQIARADVVAARQFIAEHGFEATADGIRRCRQALLATPQRALTRYVDFYSTSGCRDLVFHVQEHRLAISQISQFFEAETLAFIGFELDAGALRDYRASYPGDPAMTDLNNWDAFERDRPATFASMYQFWCQRA